MSHYEERLQQDLQNIMEQVKLMGGMTEKVLHDAVHALLTHNEELANDTVLADHPINRKMREIDKLCHAFIARHLPSAGHLRMISSVIRLNIELERIGDYAVTICRETIQLASPLQGVMGHEVESTANESQRLLHQSLTAFYDKNAESAKATMEMMADLESTMSGIYANLLSGEHVSSNKDIFFISIILAQLKRVADQSKNICEETVFAVTGETKAQKIYKVLFVDDDNSCLSQLAEAIANKNHPNSGNYSSGGRAAAQNVNSDLGAFMQEHGLDLKDCQPKKLDYSKKELESIHVIVSLQGDAKSYFDEIPFHTTVQNWDVGQLPASDDSDKETKYSEIYRNLSFNIQQLMELLRGEAN